MKNFDESLNPSRTTESSSLWCAGGRTKPRNSIYRLLQKSAPERKRDRSYEASVLLAVGLFLNHREMIRAAAIWTIPGLGIWIRYVVLEYDFVFSSALAHVGGIIVALIVLRRVRMDRIAWVYAFLWYLLMQVVSRLVTDPRLNVNVVDRIQTGWEDAFTSYWKFWVVMTALVACCLWGIGMLLAWRWPANKYSEAVATSSPG